MFYYDLHMRKLNIFFYLLLIAILFGAILNKGTILVSAAPTAAPTLAGPSPTPYHPAEGSQQYTCLQSYICHDTVVSNNNGEPTPTRVANKCPDMSDAHTVQLKTENYIPPFVSSDPTNPDAVKTANKGYYVEVLLIPDDPKPVGGKLGSVKGATSTTGTVAGDVALGYCSDPKCGPGTRNVERLASDPVISYQFKGLFGPDQKTPLSNPITIPADGHIPVAYWNDARGGYEAAQGSGGRIWQSTRSYYYFVSTLASEESKSEKIGEQQGTFKVTAEDTNCVIVRYDPFGRVFDAQTLEPVAGVQLSMLKPDGSLVTSADFPAPTPGAAPVTLFNPLPATTSTGAYNILLPNGQYKMSVSKGTIDATNVHPKYTAAYSDLYKGDLFEEKGLTHLDVPVVNNPPYRHDVEVLEPVVPFIDESASVPTAVLKGRVSHPFTTINVFAEKNVTGSNTDALSPTPSVEKRLLFTAQTDKFGIFDIKVAMKCVRDDTKCLRDDEILGKPEIIKTDLTQGTAVQSMLKRVMDFATNLLGVKKVEAASVTGGQELNFDLILNYVSGCAYDARGNKVPNATVGVYPKLSVKPYYTTTADAQGCFTIGSNNLPKFAYVLKYTTPTGQVITQTTRDFVQKNANYIATNKVNVNANKDSFGRDLPTGIQAKNRGSAANLMNNGGTGTNGSNNPLAIAGNQTTNSSLMMIVVVLLLLLGTVGLILALYIYKKNQRSQMM